MSEKEELVLSFSRPYASEGPNSVQDDVHSVETVQQQERKGTGGNRRSNSEVCSYVVVLKLIAFIVGCIAKFVTGSVFVFFLYQNDIKELFQYSQKEVELLASMMNIGLGLGFLPGLFFDKFGPTLTSVVGLLLASGSYFLIWSTTFNVFVFQDNVWLMAIYFLLAGFGPGFTLMVCLNTNIINFGGRHTGKVVGVLNAFFAGSPSVFAAVYYRYFQTGSRDTSDRFADFIFMIAVMFAVANALCGFLVRFYKDVNNITIQISNDNNEDTKVLSYNEGDLDSARQDDAEESIPLKTVLLSCDFQLLIWSFSFASAVSVVFGVNITVISKSVGLSEYDRNLTLVLPVCNAVLSSIIGILSDYFKRQIPRLSIIVFGYICFTICLLLVVIVPQYIAALMVAAGLCGVGVAIIYSMTPALLKEMTNTRNFGRNWGMALFLQAAIGMPSQILFGAMYDAQIHEIDSNNCTGTHCIIGGMTVFLGMSVLAVILGLILNCKEKCANASRRMSYQRIGNDQ